MAEFVCKKTFGKRSNKDLYAIKRISSISIFRDENTGRYFECNNVLLLKKKRNKRVLSRTSTVKIDCAEHLIGWFYQPFGCSAGSILNGRDLNFVHALYKFNCLWASGFGRCLGVWSPLRGSVWWGEYDVARPETPQWPRRLTSLTTPTRAKKK